MKIHCLVMLCVVAAGFLVQISIVEWCICLILFGLILSLELVNTAIEAVVDLVTEERKPACKTCKGYGCGRCSDCGAYGGRSRNYYFCSENFGAYMTMRL